MVVFDVMVLLLVLLLDVTIVWPDVTVVVDVRLENGDVGLTAGLALDGVGLDETTGAALAALRLGVG
jgi:hypothetical protein